MRTRNRIVIVSAALAVVFLTACSTGQDERAAEGSPGAAVQAFYDHLSRGDHAGAQALYSAEARSIVADPEVFRSWAEQATRNGAVDKVLIAASTVSEDGASADVDFDVVFDDGTTESFSVDLVDEGQGWRLGLIVPR